MNFWEITVFIPDLTIKSVLCVPIVTPDDECLAVMEFSRTTEMTPFDESHMRLAIVVSGWIGSAIFQNQQRLALQRQNELNEYLLDLTKCYFADTMLLEKLITEMVVSIWILRSKLLLCVMIFIAFFK